MRSTTTFSTIFFARKLKASESEGGLYCRITFNTQPLEFSLKRRVPLNLWDTKRNKLKGTYKPIDHEKPIVNNNTVIKSPIP